MKSEAHDLWSLATEGTQEFASALYFFTKKHLEVSQNCRTFAAYMREKTGDITAELAKLITLRGSDFVVQLKLIASRKEFHPLPSDPCIFTVGGEQDADYPSLLSVARKVVEHGYNVFLLPNPHDFRTADFILERRGVYKLFDLKNISGKSIVGSRLIESIGQANRVLLNMPAGYNTRLLAAEIRSYFETYEEALEVLVIKGRKLISIDRFDALHPSFYRLFKKRFEK